MVERFGGIDVSMDRLDVMVVPDRVGFSVENNAAGWTKLIERLRGSPLTAIGIEPSGGYERGIIRALLAAGLSVRRINPNKLRQFARARGVLAKNDRLDAEKIANLLRGGNLPQAYVYPAGLRETRDLLRRRMFLVHKRAELITHIQTTNAQYNLPAFGQKLIYAKNRTALKVAERFEDASVRKSIEVDLALVQRYEELIADLELYLERTVKVDDANTYCRLKSIPGVGKILALVLLYEIHDVRRFARVGDFVSYARLVRPDHESAKKKCGFGNKKIGNAHLRWALGEAVTLLLRESDQAKRFVARLEKKRGKGKALGILAAKLGRAVYWMLRRQEAFDVKRFWRS